MSLIKVEDCGILDKNGKLQILTTTINAQTKRSSSRRSRDDFLDKSITSYIEEKYTAHRKSLDGSTGSFSRPRKYSVRANSSRPRESNPIKSLNTDLPNRKFDKTNHGANNYTKNRSRSLPVSPKYNSGSKNKKLWYPKNRDINGNLMGFNNSRQEPVNFINPHDDYVETECKSSIGPVEENVTTREVQPVAIDFSPGVILCFSTSKPFDDGDGTITNVPSEHKEPIPRSADLTDYDRWNPPPTIHPQNQKENDDPKWIKFTASKVVRNARKNSHKNSPSNDKNYQPKNSSNFQPLTETTNNCRKSNPNEEVSSHYSEDCYNNSQNFHNYFAIQQHATAYWQQNTADNCCQECHEQSEIFRQRQNQITNHYWGGSNRFFDNRLTLVDGNGIQNPLIPFGNFLPQSCYSTASFADFHRRFVPQIYSTENQMPYRPRPILNRLAGRIANEN